MSGTAPPLLGITDLAVTFANRYGPVRAVDSVDLVLHERDRLALIGESGCGKTVLALSVLRMLPSNAAVNGTIRYRGIDLTVEDDAVLRKIRGREIALIPQNSVNALNPVLTVGRQIGESLALHKGLDGDAARHGAEALLEQAGIGNPAGNLRRYPHEFSGGMRERVLVAMALACDPAVVIADEPTAGLDVEVRAKILRLLRDKLAGRTLLLITHDIGTAFVLSDRIAVMYAGEIVEEGPVQDVLSTPMHPYTQGLLASLPSQGFHPIPGMSPSPASLPGGCRFSPRCSRASVRCRAGHPRLAATKTGRKVRCYAYD
jgi:peptide/nickel transport system ATP-binding protein